ncbi:hypothetical protein VNO78_08776 [Psophocarpus tetragonolobus]|uniref:PGG domain-containing protein n=1 Tax=Psophocarpus tetragonolobus TaxID=3891 RepID=A0AAN9SVR6_PSOTE
MEASRGIVDEVLTKHNYKRWKTLMKNYLVGKDLWSVVEYAAACETRKNAKALHIIQLSCGSKIFHEISGFENAKDVWDHLESLYGSHELRAQPDITVVVEDDNLKNLYKYLEKDDWKSTKQWITSSNGNELDLPPDSFGGTVLHLATSKGCVKIVSGLVRDGRSQLAERQDNNGYTALAFAAHYTGNMDVVRCMVENSGCKNFLGIPAGNDNRGVEIPLLLAAKKGHKEMTHFLYDETRKEYLFDQPYRIRSVLLLERCIKAEIFGVALKLLDYEQKKRFPRESLHAQSLPAQSLRHYKKFEALLTLAQKPSAFYSGCQFGFLQQIIYHLLPSRATNICDNNGDRCRCHESGWCRFSRLILCFLLLLCKPLGIREICEQKRTHEEVNKILKHLQYDIEMFNNSELNKAFVFDAMLEAAKNGIIEFIKAMIEVHHELLWVTDNLNRGIFSYAILHRKLKVFKLIYTDTVKGTRHKTKFQKDVFGNNLLHLAGHLESSLDINNRPGAALQMQLEIQWFEAVKEIVHPKCNEKRNYDGKKPCEVFTETHKELQKAGKEWAMETGRALAVVASFITTITFAAGFTVPGGNNESTGLPIFSNKRQFTIFIIADAVSLFTSATSVLMFIWIQTLSYGEQDFRKRFPCNLLIGLLLLFISVVTMVVSFSAALAIVLNKYQRMHTMFILGGIILGIILVYVLLQLLIEIFPSTIFYPFCWIKK